MTKSTTNAEMTASLGTILSRKAKIHNGAMSMARPRVRMQMAVDWSIFLSEK